MSKIHVWWHRAFMNLTPAEKALEPAIALLGERYRPQYPFLQFKHFADFALLDRMLIIEVDGDSHDKPAQKKKDLEHSMKLKALGWDVVRVANEAAMADPAGTVSAALTAPRTTLAEYSAALERLLRDYPDLTAAPAKRSTRNARSRPKKTSPSGTSRNTRSKASRPPRSSRPRRGKAAGLSASKAPLLSRGPAEAATP